MQKMFGRSVGLPMQTSTCHQIPCHPFRNHGGLHIVVEWGHNLKNVGLQHNVLTPLWTIECYCGKGEHDLSPLGKIV